MNDIPDFAASLLVVLVLGLMLKCTLSQSQTTNRGSVRRPAVSREVSFELPQNQVRDLTY